MKIALSDHRCTCGKLLFRAEPLASVVEVKCKRCGEIKVFGAGPDCTLLTVAFVIDGKGIIVDVSRNTLLLGPEHMTYIGKSIHALFPALNADTAARKDGQAVYHLPKNQIVLRDGNSIPADTYVIQTDPGLDDSPRSVVISLLQA